MSDYYELFGVPKPDEGGKEQEPAEPAGEAGDEGAKEQEFAEPADETPEEQEEENGTDPDGSGGKNEQSKEERRKQAAKRREQAQAEAIGKAVKDALEKERADHAEKLKEVFAKGGLKNTLTGQPITNMEEFEAWQKEFAAKKLESDLKAGKLTAEGLQQALATMPQVKELIDGANSARQQANSESFIARTQMELAEIRKINPEAKSLDDILKMPTGQAFASAVRKGNSFVDAYFLANREQIMKQQRASARQAARNDADGKKHMQASGQQSKGEVTVTARDREMYRRFDPSITDEEIARYVAMANKQKG